MKKLFNELFNKTSINNPPLHFTSFYNLPQNSTQKRVFHNLSPSPETEEDYQQMIKNKRPNPIIPITSLSLKQEYLKNMNYLNNGLNILFFISLLYLADSLINLKYLGPYELTMVILIASCLSISFSIILLINIRTNIILDPYGYILFYLFSFGESMIIISLYFLKIIHFILAFEDLNSVSGCRNKYICPGYFTYLLLLVFSIIIFISIFGSIKFTFLLLLESFKILLKRKKTFFQRQVEINERSEKSGTIEFIDENDSFNSSKNELKSDNILKTE